jgi:thiol-disulfide isomerase/thioredoxin
MTRRGWLFVCVALLALSWGVAAQNPAVVVFYREGCEECERMMPVVNGLEAQFPDLGFRYIETSDPDAPKMWTMAAVYGVVPSQFPVIFVGRTAIVGASLANELALRSAVAACAASSCPSPFDVVRSPTIPWLVILGIGLVLIALAALFF